MLQAVGLSILFNLEGFFVPRMLSVSACGTRAVKPDIVEHGRGASILSAERISDAREGIVTVTKDGSDSVPPARFLESSVGDGDSAG